MEEIETIITNEVRKNPGITKTKLSKAIKKNKKTIFATIKGLLERDILAQKVSSGGLVLGTSSGTSSEEIFL